jgi:serine/threonine protein kinase
MALSQGTKLGRYEIRSPLGAGGMGEVYLARDEKINRDVAIKVLPAAYAEDPERLRRFEQEAQATGALNHSNILAVYDVGTHDGAPYVVSELLEGETLRERLSHGPLPQRKVIDYALQVAHGLAAAHEKGIIHRDLKPENLFITKDGRIKILDFGLAKLTGTGDYNGSQTEVPTRRVDTDPGVVMGTIGYMSPEQLRSRRADHRTDIFSFGAILYEMLSGKRAFRGESTADTMSAILREDPPDLSETNKTISPALERVVNHCLEKNPEERFHSSRDLAFAIEALSGSGGWSGSTTTILTGRTPRKNSLRELLPWGLAAALLVTSAGLAILYLRRPVVEARQIRFLISIPEELVEVSTPIISPNGQTLAFVAFTSGKRFIYTRSLAKLEAQQVAGTEDGSYPFWSPDSRYLGFFSGNKLRKIEAAGGSVQTLCDAPNAYGGTWNRDGVILISLDTKGIHRVSAAGGAATPVFGLDETRKELSQAWPYFLPDGRHFFYQSWTGRPDDSTIIVASLDGSVRKLLMKADSSPIYAAPGYLLFARGSTVLAQAIDTTKLQLNGEAFPVAENVNYLTSNSYASISVSDTGVMAFWVGGIAERQLIWFDRSGKQLNSVGPPGDINDIVLSPDGKKLAMQQLVNGNSDIWLMDLERAVPSRFTFAPETDDTPVWTADGQFVVFSGGENLFSLYRKNSSGVGNPEILLRSETGKEPFDWSNDGKFLLYTDFGPKTLADLWVLPAGSAAQPYSLVATEFEETMGRFSPDGRWFAYTSNESGRTEVYVQSFPVSGGKWLISNGGGSQPHWRGDGKELFYVAPDKRLMSVNVNAGSTFETTAPTALFLTQVVSFSAPNRYVVTSDGQRFLVNCPAGEVSRTPFAVVINWTSSLNP